MDRVEDRERDREWDRHRDRERRWERERERKINILHNTTLLFQTIYPLYTDIDLAVT